MLLTGNYQTDKNVLKILAASWPDLTIGQVLKKTFNGKENERIGKWVIPGFSMVNKK